MKNLLLFTLLNISNVLFAQVTVTEIGEIPKRTSNNVVCEGFINGSPYLYSFGGIDSTKIYSGIHQESFRYDLTNGQNMALPHIPDTLGKIAMGISRIKNTIYLTGGYHVYADGSEKSSDKVHRFDITSNTFLEDGAPIPVATDDHVQAVWQDSLIYLITGWSDVGNIPDVQIYNPTTNNWLTGTSVPSGLYRSFGSSGAIVGDTIYYFGGAYSSSGFNIQNKLRKGVINPNNPQEITWTHSTPDQSIVGYRMASTLVGNQIHWIGGSNNTYNYNGIAYDGSGGVEPNNRDLYISTTNDEVFTQQTGSSQIPMDLRSIARVNDTTQYIVGGMLSGQEITNKIFKIQWASNNLSTENHSTTPVFYIQENPVVNALQIYSESPILLNLYTINGKLIEQIQIEAGYKTYSINHLPSGVYFLKESQSKRNLQKIIIQH